MVSSYKFLLLVLAAIATEPATMVSADHRNDCEGPSDAHNYFINFCEEKCVCEETDPGEWAHVCYREREEFTCMSTARRQRFLDTYKAVTTPGHPQYALMEELISMHDVGFFSIHSPTWFLPWHRYYAMAVEDVLRNEDCRVTLPWWRWSKKSATWWMGSPFLSASTWLGTDSNGGCVNDGAFAYPAWQPNAGGCLTRDFFTTSMPSMSQISTVLALPPANYVAFSNALEGIHNTPHMRIQGDMSTYLSPRAPEFFLHHGYIDQLWDAWQRKSPAHLESYSYDPLAELVKTFGATPNNVNDHLDLKASGVRYVHGKSHPSGPGHLNNLPFCLMVPWKPAMVQKQIIFDGGKIEGAIMNATDAMRRVPQLRPETPSFSELRKRFDWWFTDADPLQREELNVKIARMAEQNKEFANAVENPISPEDLAKLGNPASVAMGLDLDSDEFTKILLEAKICQEGWDFDDTKGECKKNKQASKDLRREIKKQGKIVGAEVFAKKDAPKRTN